MAARKGKYVTTTYVEELEQDPFDPTDFVERLAWRFTDGEASIDPLLLHKAFEEEIYNLQCLSDQYEQTITRLKEQSLDDEERLAVTLDKLQEDNAAETTRIKLLESAEIIYKLSAIASELSPTKYAKVQQRIQYKYDMIERLMIDEFTRAYRLGARGKVRQIATILSNFKQYPECVNAYVENIQVGAFRSGDVFVDIQTLVEKCATTIDAIFPSPDQVRSKLLLNLLHGRLLEHIEATIGEACTDDELWLTQLYELYTRTSKLCSSLSHISIGSDATLLPSMTRRLFARYLSQYVQRETTFLRRHCKHLLERFYASKQHQKRAMKEGGMTELRRDLQARVFQPESFGGESFLSEEIAISILQETKLALQRCSVLCSAEAMPSHAKHIFAMLIQALCTDHIEYAIELARSSIPTGDQKTEPPTHFLEVVRQAVGMCHLFDKQYDGSVRSVVAGTSVAEQCLDMKEKTMVSIESKMASGIDKQLLCMVAHIKHLLTCEQRRPDYALGADSEQSTVIGHALATPACVNVCRYVAKCRAVLQSTLDGGNLTQCMTELGTRWHRMIIDHIYMWQYTMDGGVMLLCDMKEYRDTAGTLQVPLVAQLFDTLQSLCNLLTLPPQNLTDTTASELLGGIDHPVLVQFVTLRADYKSAKLFNEFR